MIMAVSIVTLFVKAQTAKDTLSTPQFSLLKTVMGIQLLGLLVLQISTLAIVHGERNPKEISTGDFIDDCILNTLLLLSLGSI